MHSKNRLQRRVYRGDGQLRHAQCYRTLQIRIKRLSLGG